MAGNDETLRLKVEADTAEAKRDLKQIEQQAESLEKKPYDLEVRADTTSLKGFAQSVKTNMASADGAMGKTKALGGTIMDGIKQNAGPALIAGGAAIVAFGVKAAAQFVAVSKAASDMGDAIGTSTEEASRWIAVADDFGIGAEQLESAFGKVAKTLDTGPWEKYGIATRNAGGQARAVNDIIIDALGTLSKISNETERARVGNELFGKGYANLAPLIGKTADEYKEMLGAVEDGQVVTDKEARKAEKLRLAQDALADSLNEVTLALGQVAAEAAPAIEAMSELVDVGMKLGGIELPGSKGEFSLMTGSAALAADAVAHLRNELDGKVGDGFIAPADAFAGAAANADDATEAVRTYTDSLDVHIDMLTDLAAAYADGQEAQRAFYDEQLKAVDSQYAAEAATAKLLETIVGYGEAVKDAEGDTGKLRDVQLATKDAAVKYAEGQVRAAQDTAAASGTFRTAQQDQAAYLGALVDSTVYMEGPQKQAVIEYIARLEGIPPERVTDIIANPDQEGLNDSEQKLANVARDRDAEINVTADTSFAESQMRAAISRIQNGQWSMGRVAAPTMVAPTSTVGPSQQAATTSTVRYGNTTTNITLNTRATAGRELTRELNRWARLNGRSRG